jgi:hypothetical protein
LIGVGLNGGDQLAARWYLDSEVSDPTPVPLIVLPAPGNLSPLVFLSQVHDCVNWILVGGAYPGALIEIYNGATLIGTETAVGDVATVRISGTINTGNVLHAVQSVVTPSGTVKSGATPSLPSEALPYRENSLPPPAIGPVPGCTQAVPVSGLLQGASTHLATGTGELYYPFVGAGFWALLGREAHPPESFSASQHFERCKAFSPKSAPAVPVDKTRPIRKPLVQQDNITCAAAKAIMVSNLESGAILTFKIVATSATAVIGKIGVGQGVSSTQFWLPDLSAYVPPAPPYPALVVVQEMCSQNVESDPVYFTKFQGGVFPPFIVEPVRECSQYVQLNMVGGAVVRLYSDQLDSPVISLRREALLKGSAPWRSSTSSSATRFQDFVQLLASAGPIPVGVADGLGAGRLIAGITWNSVLAGPAPAGFVAPPGTVTARATVTLRPVSRCAAMPIFWPVRPKSLSKVGKIRRSRAAHASHQGRACLAQRF